MSTFLLEFEENNAPSLSFSFWYIRNSATVTSEPEVIVTAIAAHLGQVMRKEGTLALGLS